MGFQPEVIVTFGKKDLYRRDVKTVLNGNSFSRQHQRLFVGSCKGNRNESDRTFSIK